MLLGAVDLGDAPVVFAAPLAMLLTGLEGIGQGPSPEIDQSMTPEVSVGWYFKWVDLRQHRPDAVDTDLTSGNEFDLYARGIERLLKSSNVLNHLRTVIGHHGQDMRRAEYV